MNIDRDEIVRLTEEYGGQWGINHTRRLMQIVSIICVISPRTFAICARLTKSPNTAGKNCRS